MWWKTKKKKHADIGCRRPHFRHHTFVDSNRLDLPLLLLVLHHYRGTDLALVAVVVLGAGDDRDHWRKRRIVALDYWCLTFRPRRRAMGTVSVRHHQIH